MPSQSYDVLIVGGGLAGTAIAYELTRRGSRILLLEAHDLCSGTTGASAGRVQIIESETEDYLGLVLAGVRRLQGLGEELACDLEWELPGHLTLVANPQDWGPLQERTSRLAARGVAAEMLDQHALREAEPLLNFERFLGAAYSQEGHLNPFQLCLGYARAAQRQGAEMMAHAAVLGFESARDGVYVTVSNGERYFGKSVIVAAGAWSGSLLAQAGLFLPMGFTHAEALITERLARSIHHHVGLVGFYEAVHGSRRTVTLGVGQHRNGTILVSNAIEAAEQIDTHSSYWGMPAIARALADIFPPLATVRVMRTWSAPSPFLPDYLPAIGWLPNAKHMFVATGFHLALPTIPVLSEWIADSILGMEVPGDLGCFSPARFSDSSAVVEGRAW
jgi:glycine/D-amino acid oxidase-like deaminating enzyme